MPNPLTAAELAALQEFATPSLSNGIETFNIRPRNTGFMSSEIRCIFPEMPPMIGYAFTVKISAAQQAERPRDVWEYRRAVLATPGPKIIVIQDLDEQVVGSFWGEVNGNIHKALGAVGTVTNGGVRDLNEVRALGFQFLASAAIVSHAYVHMVDFGTPVKVGGLLVHPGDLIHADKHGAIVIPHEIAREVPAAAAEVERGERAIIECCQSADFSVPRLKELMGAFRSAQAARRR